MNRISSKISSKQQFIITATIIGTTLGWFEFALFGMMASLLIDIFLPKVFLGSSFLYPFLMILSVIARPIGGIVFGKIGDKQGRKFALLRTVGFMVVPLLLTAVLPSYRQIGYTALILLAFIFLLQGFSLGGEFPGSAVFLIESAHQKMKGYFGSWIYFGVYIGMFLAAGDIYLLRSKLSLVDLEEWGWRISFFISALVAIIALFSRRLLRETPFFQKAKEFGHLDKTPIFDIFHKYKKMLLYGMGLVALETVGFNSLILFSTEYFTNALGLPLAQISLIHFVTIFVLIITTPLAGKAAIRLGSKRLARWAIYGMLITALPAYILLSQKILWVILTCQGVLAVFLAFYLSNLPTILCSLFPVEVRYSGVATSMNFSILIFASIGIIFITLISKQNSSPLWPGLYWISGALISLWSLNKITEQHHK